LSSFKTGEEALEVGLSGKQCVITVTIESVVKSLDIVTKDSE